MHKTWMYTLPIAALALSSLALSTVAHAQESEPASPPPPQAAAVVPAPPPAPAPEEPIKRLGIGYKVGNGIGFLGADLIVTALPNLVLDIQVAAVTGFDSGFALAPSLQGYLRPRGSSPYIGVGVQHVRVTLDDADATGTGYFANIGYEWKWTFGLGILLGGGVQYLDEVKVVSSTQEATLGGGANVNLEFGVRYRFL